MKPLPRRHYPARKRLVGFTAGFLLAVTLGAFLPNDAIAQSTPEPAFVSFRDSLAGLSDTSELRRLLKQRDRLTDLQSGLVALRLGELRGDPDYSQAVALFRKAAREDPAQPFAWYGLALAEAGRSEWEMRDNLRLGSRVGLGALEHSADHHARALQADPRFIPAALALSRIELSLLDTARLRRARDVLRRTIRAVPPPASADLLLAWGRLERATGSLDSAGVAFERYLAGDHDRAIGLLELARTRLALGRADGESAYYEGAASNDPDAVSEYRADLAVIAGAADLAEFDRTRGQARAAFLHRFWTDRDHLELRKEGERLREHYRRLLYARLNFPLTVSRRFYNRTDAYRSGNTELDDRGIIYVRQGEPAKRLRPFVFGAMPNESWRYDRGDGDLLFHFSSGYDGKGGGDLYDYRLVESVLDLHGAADAPRDQLLLSRQSLSPVYSRMLNWGVYGSAGEQSRERNIGVTSIQIGTTTDSYELAFSRRLLAFADLVSVGRAGDRGLAHVVFGISAANAPAPKRDTEGEYGVRVRVVALDRHDRSVGTLDTVVVVNPGHPLQKDEYIVGRAVLPLPAGLWDYRAAVQLGDSVGVVFPRDSVRVASADGMILSLSDIALGTPGRSVTWLNDRADTVLLAPSALFRRSSAVGVYYEVTGAHPGQQYRHEITVLRPDARRSTARRPLVSVFFDEAATDTVIRSRRFVRLDQLKRGEYLVEVRVTGPDGSSQTRTRAIRLIDR